MGVSPAFANAVPCWQKLLKTFVRVRSNDGTLLRAVSSLSELEQLCEQLGETARCRGIMEPDTHRYCVRKP